MHYFPTVLWNVPTLAYRVLSVRQYRWDWETCKY